jgi:hypothetical protein
VVETTDTFLRPHSWVLVRSVPHHWVARPPPKPRKTPPPAVHSTFDIDKEFGPDPYCCKKAVFAPANPAYRMPSVDYFMGNDKFKNSFL